MSANMLSGATSRALTVVRNVLIPCPSTYSSVVDATYKLVIVVGEIVSKLEQHERVNAWRYEI